MTPGRTTRVRAAALVLAVVCVACTGEGPSTLPGTDEPSPSATLDPVLDEPRLPVPPDLAAEFERLLDQRAAGVITGDRGLYTKTLADDDAFRQTQDDYFDNLEALPLAEFSLTLDRASLVRDGDDYRVEILRTLQLAGFDDVPITSRDRFTFTPRGPASRRFAIASVRDAAWEEAAGVVLQPWEARPIEVRRTSGVLGIFDDDSIDAADRIMRSAEQSIAQVAGVLPVGWSQSVVIYALPDTGYQAQLPNVPGGDVDRIDALAVSLPAADDDPTLADTRLVLHPRMLTQEREPLDRLMRHEIVHVALGEMDDAAPLWLSEGIAEYLSVRPLAPEDRSIPRAVIAAAREKRIVDLPNDAAFNSGDPAVNYALAWWACEYLVATYGDDVLWRLLEQSTADDVDPATLSEDVLGINTRTLARKAGKLIVAAYAPQRPAGDGDGGDTDTGADPTPTAPGEPISSNP